jgi:acyl carrier protein
MTEQETLNTLTRIARDLMGDDSIALTSSMKGRDIPGWDSSTYVNFVVAAEIELKIKFKLADIESFETFGDMVKAIQAVKG